MILAVGEAHNYLSDPSNIREQYIIGRARAAAKQGRKDKLGLMMGTQNPDDIDGEILKQTNSNIFLQLRDEVVDDVSSVPGEYRRDIPDFGKGQAIVKTSDVEALEVVRLPFGLSSIATELTAESIPHTPSSESNTTGKRTEHRMLRN